MAQTREIKKRIKAVGTIQRITKTMQMIATAKFTAAVGRTKDSQPYTQTIRQLVAEVAGAAGDVEHPLLRAPDKPAGRELLLVIGSDRGLCGAYNANVLRRAIEQYRSLRERNLTVHLETSGKKPVSFFKFQRIAIDERHTIGDKPSYDDVERIARRYIEMFMAREVDAVRVAFMRFESASRQRPEVMQLLPIASDVVAEETQGATGPSANYEFSPSSEAMLDDLLPLSVKTMLFQAFQEAVVSEQIMRMVAMKAATENARDLGRNLKRQFNRARQTQITTELMEVIGGAAALE